MSEPLSLSAPSSFEVFTHLKRKAEFHIMRQYKWNRSYMSSISHYQLKKSSTELLCSLCVILKPPKCVRYGPSAVLCVPGLSLCSQSFVCLMTSLRGLLALDSKSQNEELPYSHVFKGAPSRYMTVFGNFCHDPLIINIKLTQKTRCKMMCAFCLIAAVPAGQGSLVGAAIPARITVY